VIAAVRGEHDLDVPVVSATVRRPRADVLTDDDLQLALWVCYELHYAGFDDVDDTWEWDPDLLAVRRELETVFEAELRRRTRADVRRALEDDGDVADRLFALADRAEGPSLAGYLHRRATEEQFLEAVVHRSVYQLKEADPETWAIPRLTGSPKVALVEVQYDEYGGGRPERQHAHLYARGMEACGLEPSYGAYVDRLPGSTLARANAMSLLGLHRRLRGAAVGHFAAVEVTSSLPCRKYVKGIERLGMPQALADYFDEHVEADAVHEQVATRDICGALVEQEPALLEDVLFGAAVCLLTDRVLAEQLLGAWEHGAGSLLPEPVRMAGAVA
jgi:hypothetical protein